MTRIWWILIRALKSLKNLHFDWFLLCKVYNVWPKKVQRSYISWNWRVMQNLKKNWLAVWKMTWGIRMHELETYRGVMRYDNEEWCKIWNGIDFPVQNWHWHWHKKFWPEYSRISETCTLMGWFWPKYIIFQLKKYRVVMFNGTQDWYKVWRKTDLCFQKLTWGIWQIFTRALESFQIGALMASFSLVENLCV